MKMIGVFSRFLTLVILLFLLFNLLFIAWILIPMPSADKMDTIVQIPYGYNSHQIQALLKKNHVIRKYNLPFGLLTQVLQIDNKLQSGEYRFTYSQNLLQVILQIAKGKVILHSITIPEGYQSEQIAQLLENNDIIDGEKFLNLVDSNSNPYREGYLFPDTYEFPKNYTENQVLYTMYDNFKKNVFVHLSREDSFPSQLNFDEIIVLASIIEKEAQSDEEKPKIASVFHNRLASSMPLQSCATIQYLLEERKENLDREDLKIDSAYNTYLYSGLPPQAICNPGLQSILAAAYPAQEDYYYFVLGKDGTHIFSKTYQEHLNNKP